MFYIMIISPPLLKKEGGIRAEALSYASPLTLHPLPPSTKIGGSSTRDEE